MEKIELKLMDNLQVARIFRFRYNAEPKNCEATIVYFRPLTEKVSKNVKDDLDTAIENSIKTRFNDVTIFSEDIYFVNQKDNLKKIYDGGRPSVPLEILLTPALSADEILKKIGKNFSAYKLVLRVFLTCIADTAIMPKSGFAISPFPYPEFKDLLSIAEGLESL